MPTWSTSYVQNAESEEEDTIITEAPVRKDIRLKAHGQRSPKLEGQKSQKIVTFKSKGHQEILSELVVLRSEKSFQIARCS